MDDEFKVSGIPVTQPGFKMPEFDWRVTSNADRVSGEIELVTKMMEKIEREIVATKSRHVRKRLIDLGWTPPEDE